jgi:uncharacterized protein YneF (UPF0154 family)
MNPSKRKELTGEKVKINQQRKGLASIATIAIILALLVGCAIGGTLVYKELTKEKVYSSNPYLNKQLVKLWNDIATDKTNEHQYVKEVYECNSFSKSLDDYLDSKGWESYEVWVYPKKGTSYNFFGDSTYYTEAHAIVGIKVYDENSKAYLVLVEPQSDEEVFNRFDADNDGKITYYTEGAKYSMDSNGLHGWDGQTTCEGNLFILFGET